MAASSAVMAWTVSPCAPLAGPDGAAPNAPKSTLRKERFMARLMMTERMKPEAPSSAPAMTTTSLPMAKPVAAEARPAYELSSEITTGMSAPPMGSTSETPNANPSATIA